MTTCVEVNYEELIQNSFSEYDLDRYQDFLLDEVGIVVAVGLSPGKQRPYADIETGSNGCIRAYLDHSLKAPIMVRNAIKFIPTKLQLRVGDKVTLTRSVKWPEQAHRVMLWKPKMFRKLLGRLNRYRLIQTHEQSGLSRVSNDVVLWDGTDLVNLKSQYPKDVFPLGLTSPKLRIECMRNGKWALAGDVR